MRLLRLLMVMGLVQLSEKAYETLSKGINSNNKFTVYCFIKLFWYEI